MFLNRKNIWIVFLFILLTHLKLAFNAYTCPPSYNPLTVSQANETISEICANVTLNTKYRIEGDGSMECTSSSTAHILQDDTNPIIEALCWKYPPYSHPVYFSGTQCPPGFRVITYEEADANKNTICPLLPQWDMARIDVHGKFGGSGYHCIVELYSTDGVGNIICTSSLSLSVQIVSSGECSSPCTTCVNTPTTCTSCSAPTSVFYNSSCYESCPIGSYESGINTCSCKFLLFA